MAKPFDVFVCHAGEDKPEVANPLAEELRRRGYEVWYDDFVLRLGDSLRRRIDEGLARSRVGVVVLSPSFFAKEWPQRELDGLTAGEIKGVKVILPVWHRITHHEVAERSPMLADRVAVSTDQGMDVVVARIVEVIGPPRTSATSGSSPRAGSGPEPKANPAAPVVTAPASAPREAIRVIGIVEEGIGRPGNDGTRGGALYRVPLKLSQRPSGEWAATFEHLWNQPFVPGGSLRHRPGIASVVGDTVVLNGTTIEEVEEVHLTTVRNVIAEVNEKIGEFERRERERIEREAEAETRRQAEIRERINRTRFD